MRGMYAPIRNRPSKSFLNDWADSWTGTEGGWLTKIYDIADFNPILAKKIRRECTVLEIAMAWKSKVALSDYAWCDG